MLGGRYKHEMGNLVESWKIQRERDKKVGLELHKQNRQWSIGDFFGVLKHFFENKGGINNYSTDTLSRGTEREKKSSHLQIS
jgi:hypothetical protein